MRRQRLFDALDSPFRLIFVEGVPGSGKRTLLGQWRAEANGEHRIVINAAKLAASPLGVVRTVSAELGKLAKDATVPPAALSSSRLQARLIDQVAELPFGCAVGITAAESISTEGVEALFDLLDASKNFRLLVSGFELSEAINLARNRRISHAIIDEQDLHLTPDELREFLSLQGIKPTAANTEALMRGSNGHVGSVRSALTHLPLESELATILPDQPLSAFLAFDLPKEVVPSAFSRFALTMAQVPRFSLEEARQITQLADADQKLHRLHMVGAGEMSYHPGLNTRVFTWQEHVRSRLAEYEAAIVDLPRAELTDRIVQAAQACGDQELRVAALIRSGDLASAEAVLGDWLWDVIPQTPGPLWRELEEVALADLIGFPAVLCLRMRLAHGTASAASSKVAANAACARLAEIQDTDPWRRFGALVTTVVLAHHTDDRQFCAEQVIRARDFALDLITDTVVETAPGVISDLLLLTAVCLQTGSTTAASELAALAIRLITTRPAALDPVGDRRRFAERVELLSRRERGLDYPPAAENLLNGIQFLRREEDIVAAYLINAWLAIDAGKLDAAQAHCQVARRRLRYPREWPALMWARMVILALQGDRNALQLAAKDYAWSCLNQTGHAVPPPISAIHESGSEILRRATGFECPVPDFLPPSPQLLVGTFYPRIEYALELVNATIAIRAGRVQLAKHCLENALNLMPRYPIAPLALGLATEDELDELIELVKDHPDANRLQVQTAKQVAIHATSAPVKLSEREMQVLTYLRAEATNKEMAAAMHLSVNTVKFHRANLMAKLGAANRRELLELAALVHL